MESSSVSNLGSSSAQTIAANDALRDVNLDDFLGLMLAELQNQDPLNPLENHQILQQISEIRSIEVTDRLTGTLDALLLGQNLSSASSMIGKQVEGLTEAGDEVSGEVERVTVTDGVAKLTIGDIEIPLKNVRSVVQLDDAGA